MPESGHNFTQSIDIYMVDNKLVLMRTEEKEADRDETIYKEYMRQRENFNQLVNNWSELEKIKAVENIPVTEVLPDKYIYPPNVILRTEAATIPKEMWEGFQDKAYESTYQRVEFVDEYFSVGIYTLNTNPRNNQTIPAGVNTVKETSVEVTSMIKDTLTQNTSIRFALQGAISKPEAYNLSAELESQYSISDVHEESTGTVKRETVTYTIEASDKDRIFVQWIIMEAVAIYRKKKNGQVSLVAISEWPLAVMDKVYEY